MANPAASGSRHLPLHKRLLQFPPPPFISGWHQPARIRSQRGIMRSVTGAKPLQVQVGQCKAGRARMWCFTRCTGRYGDANPSIGADPFGSGLAIHQHELGCVRPDPQSWVSNKPSRRIRLHQMFYNLVRKPQETDAVTDEVRTVAGLECTRLLKIYGLFKRISFADVM